MPVKNQFVTDDLTRMMLKKNYNIKHNGSGDLNLMETIENISEGMATDTNSSTLDKDKQHEESRTKQNFNLNSNLNLNGKNNINTNTNTYTNTNTRINTRTKTNKKQILSEKSYSGKNKKTKGINNISDTSYTANIRNNSNQKNEKKDFNETIDMDEKNENKNDSSHTSYANISQIYDTDDSNVKEENTTTEETEQNENNFISLMYAFLFIIIGLVIISHMYLDEDHIIIKKIAVINTHILKVLKAAPFGRNVMKIVTSINSGIDTILNQMVKKATITRPYVEAFKKLNTEFSILSLISLFSFFVITLFINIIWNIVEVKYKPNNNNKDTKKNQNQNIPVLVMNRMSVEEFEDKTYTYKELKKLHEDPDFLCLKNKRAGEGVSAWNWQSRRGNAETKKAHEDICSDIELSDVTEE